MCVNSVGQKATFFFSAFKLKSSNLEDKAISSSLDNTVHLCSIMDKWLEWVKGISLVDMLW